MKVAKWLEERMKERTKARSKERTKVTRHAGLCPTCRITAVSLGAPPAPPTMKLQMQFHSNENESKNVKKRETL